MANDGMTRLLASASRNPVVIFFGACLDFLNRLGRHWFMLLILLGGACLAIRGTILLDFGVAYLFRENRPLDGFAPDVLLQSPSFFTALLSVMLAGAAWVFAVDLDAQVRKGESEPTFLNQLPGLTIHIVLLGSLPFLALLYPASDAIAPLRTGEAVRAALGWIAGLFLSLTVVGAASVVETVLTRVTTGRLGLRSWIKRHARHFDDWIAWENVVWRVMIRWLMYVIAWGGIITLAVHLPAVAIFALVGVALGAYVALNFVVERMRFYLVIAAFALATVVRWGDAFLYTLPGLENQYAACDALAGSGAAKRATALAPLWCARGTGANANKAGTAGGEGAGDYLQLPRAASLRALKTLRLPDKSGDRTGLPKLVVVAVSGGGYRAAFWGAMVLDRLRRESARRLPLEGFTESIRLLTGASGGMVPAAYFVTIEPEDLANPDRSLGIENMLARDIAIANGLGHGERSYDSLSAIAQQLVQQDIFNAFRPGRVTSDRGRTLDRQWGRLNMTFAQLSKEELAGRRPSLILSPMIAETGQPLLISNLDLTGISATAKGARQTVDLFRSLPEAARGLTLATAVRMSGTFPFISPSVSLPTIPPLHPLDAGYFDNYGIGVALGYLKQPDVLAWMGENTSGVILVEIDAYPVHTAKPESASQECSEVSHTLPMDWAVNAFSPMTSSLTGLFSSRGASMVFRNDQSLDSVQQLVRKVPGKNGRPLSFDIVSFENAARASFSWYLPQRDLECMRGQLDAKHNKDALARLMFLWRADEVSSLEAP